MIKRCQSIDELINAHVSLCRARKKRRRARQQRTESQAAAPVSTSSLIAMARDKSAPLK
jgi:hypothetical protein